jgi:enterobactin synthetase component D / holo-[acyl-carrier protein] synthase
MNLKNASSSEMAAWLSSKLDKRVSITLDTITNLQGHLYAAEESHLGRAIPKREREFRSGRTAARKCLLELGMEPGPILIGKKREPVWPDNCVGTISHCGNFCLVMLSPSPGTLSLGADIEHLGRVKAHLWPRLFTVKEKTYLLSLDSRETDRAATAMFSAKEAFFKLQHPLTGLWLEFLDAEVALDTDNTFRIKVPEKIKETLPWKTFITGTWVVWQDCCITAIEMK